MRLDVGCGNNPTGDVNCDLHICDVDNHRQTDTPTSVPLNVASNFVLCDCMHLPFADNTFNEVFCAQLIEHLETPMKLMKELADRNPESLPCCRNLLHQAKTPLLFDSPQLRDRPGHTRIWSYRSSAPQLI